ncbi:hypothetical protein BDF20DRAFT_165220 [Mycotypha africana]|uniref:uncharacterized protein n=1 Tax=Mycotypha africana TaxID=64632 RepID=UPI00230051B6|nr:uncharacterized protein BDF20DRAFT_165220 [Mycotypha africana]KAI8968174.1 hypothetical protein BDF20DRAFT_165220 [Mycotypha africana]
MSNDVAFRNNRWSTPLNRSATNNSRFSVCSNVSQSAYGMRYEQAVVGQEVASKINISKLAIESTAFRDPQPQSTPVPQYSSTLSFTTAPSESVLENNQNDGSPDEYDSMGNEKVGFDILQAKKLKRRVTFDMDNIQVQTIPANMSSSLDNLSDTDDVNDTESSDSEDEEYKNKLTSDTDRVESKGHPFDQNHSTPATFHTGRRLVAEPSIKKLSIDNDPVHQPKLQKIDFWYPLNPPLQRTVLSTDRNGYYAQNTSLPFIKPLAETEKLIDDAIEREKKALQMNTCAITSRKNIFIDGRSAASTRFSASPALSSSDEMSSILICDSEEEEEDYDTIIRSRDPVSLSRSKPIVVHGKITDLNPNSQPIPLPLPASFHEQSSNNHPISHLPQLQSSLADSDSHFEHNLEMIHSNDTVSNVIPAPLPINNQSHSDDESIVFSKSPLSLETDFSKSIYNEFAKRHNQKLIPMEEFEPPKLTFPLEHELIPVSGAFNSDPALSINPQEDENSSSDDGMDIGYCLRPSSGTSVNDSISTVDEVNDPVWIDYTAETKLSSSSEAARKLFFVKVLKAENLDFPIENNESNIFCTVRYKDKEVKSIHQKMKHTVNINQEMIMYVYFLPMTNRS